MSAPPTEPAPSSEAEPRRPQRARFDALLERLDGIDEALHALNGRLLTRPPLERRADASGSELLEGVARAAERQASAIEGLVFSMERVDERLERLERLLARQARRSAPPPPVDDEPQRPARTTGTFSVGDLDLSNGSSMHGSLSDISLGTVMAMLELERRTGRLRVSAEDGSLACFELVEGAVAASRINESDIDSVECLRQVLGWRSGRFWFRQTAAGDSPRALGSLLLEATRQNDEARAEALR